MCIRDSSNRAKNAAVLIQQNSAMTAQQVAYATGVQNATQQKKGVGMQKTANDKKLTQNFMKVPRGGAGLIGGTLEGQTGYLAK